MKAFKRATWIAATIAVIFSVVNLFVIGGDSFVIALGDVAPIILSILTFTTVIILWRTFAPGTASRKLWAWFMVGWGLWAIGEILYVVLGYILDEIPYPSLADIAYIVGTIFLIIGLILRLRQNLRELSTTQKLVYWLLALGTVAAVYFLVLQPIVADVAEYGLLMTALNAFYPISDLILFLLGLRLIFDYTGRGASSTGWLLVVIGFLLITIADLVYTYAVSYDLYFPNDQANLLSTLGSSIPYTLAYMFWLMGLYRLQIKEEAVATDQSIPQPACVENAHIVFFVNRDLVIDEVSANAWVLQTGGMPNGSDFIKMMGLKAEDRQTIIGALSRDGNIADMPLEIRTVRNEIINAKLNALRLQDPQRNFIGALLVVRVLASSNEMDTKLTEYQQSIAKQVKVKSGSNEDKQVCKFMADYYHPILLNLEKLAYQHGGAQQGLVFLENLNQRAAAENWGVKVTKEGVAYPETDAPQTLMPRLTQWHNAAKEQLQRMVDVKVVDEATASLRAKYNDDVKNCYEYIMREYLEKPISK